MFDRDRRCLVELAPDVANASDRIFVVRDEIPNRDDDRNESERGEEEADEPYADCAERVRQYRRALLEEAIVESSPERRREGDAGGEDHEGTVGRSYSKVFSRGSVLRGTDEEAIGRAQDCPHEAVEQGPPQRGVEGISKLLRGERDRKEREDDDDDLPHSRPDHAAGERLHCLPIRHMPPMISGGA